MRTILPTLLIVIGWLHQARADEQRVFWGHTVEGWARVFRDKSSTKGSRLQAVWALGCFGPEAQAVVPDLIDELQRGQIRDEAIEALVRIGAGTEQTVPLLTERFLKKGCLHLTGMGTFLVNPGVKDDLVRIGGPAVPALLDVLNCPNRDMRICAAEALGDIGPAAREAVPALIRVLEHSGITRETEILSRHTVQALGRIGPEAKTAVPTLTDLLDKKNGNDFDVVMALDRIGVPPVQKLLDTFLRTGDPFIAYQLAWLGPKAREAAPSLRDALTDKRPQVRISAAVALAHIEPSASEAIPVLIEALSHLYDESLDVRDVPQALARFGPRARAAMPILIGLVKQGDSEANVFKALVQIDPEGKECVPALVSVLKHQDYEIVDVAARCLGLLGPRAKDAVPALAVAMTRDFGEEFYNGYDPQVSAARALQRIGSEAASAIPALIAALKYRHVVPQGFGDEKTYRDSTAAAAAAQVLGSFGAEAKAAVPALIEAVQTREKDDANWPVRQAAILALGQMAPDARAAIPAIRHLMKEDGKDSEYLPEVMVALYQLAPDGKELAERWLAKPMSGRVEWEFRSGLEGRALVFGAMNRTNFETDWLTRSYLEQLESILVSADPRDGNQIEILEWWFEKTGRLQSAGRLAIPRLTKYKQDTNPWVRMWAAETLEQIVTPMPQ